MKRVLSSLMVAAAVMAPVLAAPVHFSVVKSVPAKDATLEAAPARLQIWFSQSPAAVVSEITLKRGDAEVELEKTVVAEKDKSMHADPVKPLEPGAYTFTWRAAGDDGHVMTGDVAFTIAPRLRR